MSRIMRKKYIFVSFSNVNALQDFNFGIKLSQTEDELAGMQARNVLAEEEIFIEL